ncbi:hypothetical protein PENTCL1PPCAC_2676, partial [Pristionchus entomophagus]
LTMKKVLTDEERAAVRPRRGKKIISEKQARMMANKTYEPESFLNDPSIVEPEMDVSVPPTLEEMMAAAKRQRDERAAEYKAMGKTGKEKPLGYLPPINFTIKPRIDLTSSESEAESDKENDVMDGSMNGMEKEEEMEKEADETTPIAQQRSMGVAGPSSSPAVTAPLLPIPSTPPARPDSGFRKPRLPQMRGAPRHSTPKVLNPRVPRASLGTVFSDISIIANTSIQGQHTVRSDGSTGEKTRKESIESRGGRTSLEVSSIREEEEEAQEAMAANGTFTVAQPADAVADRDGTFVVEGGEEEEEEAVQVHVEAVVIRRQSVQSHPRNVSTASMEEEEVEGEGEGGEEEEVNRVEVVGVSMRRSSVHAPRDVTMMSIEEEEENGEGGGRKEEESREMEDVEMDSVSQTPVRRPSLRPAKRPSIEHPLDDTSSPMAVAIARRTSVRRDIMVKPKVSMASTARGGGTRKISTGSTTSSIPFEDLSRSNLSMDSGEGSTYEDPKTPERTPRTERQLRQSLAARHQRQSQLQRLPILEETDVQGGRREDESEEEEEDEDGVMEGRVLMREEGETMGRDSAAPTTPVPRLSQKPLSQKLQSSVDRLSQPRHRQEAGQPCARVQSPARGPTQRAARVPSLAPLSSPSPARRFHSTFNQTSRGIMTGYTPNQRIDTTLMEDDGGNAKSGMAPRIKRIPRRDQGGKKGAATVLTVREEREEREDIEETRKARGQKATTSLHTTADGTLTKDNSLISLVASVTPVTSPLRRDHYQHHNQSFPLDDPFHDMNDGGGRRRRREEEEEEEDEDEDDVFRPNHSTASSTGMAAADAAEDGVVFARPANPLPATPRSGSHTNSRRSNASRRSMWSDSEVASDMDRLSSRASQISIDDAVAMGGRRAAAAAAFDPSFNLPNLPPTPKTPFRRLVSNNSDLFSTDTPGVDKRLSSMDTEEEEEWAANQDSSLWRGDVSTASDENEALADESQMSIVEEEDANERVLAPRKLIAPTADSPGVRRSTRVRMKPVRAWLGEQAQYEYSPRSGGQRLVGVNQVVIKDKLFIKTGTADIVKAVEANKKTQKQRSIANKKRKAQKRAQEEEEDSE